MSLLRSQCHLPRDYFSLARRATFCARSTPTFLNPHSPDVITSSTAAAAAAAAKSLQSCPTLCDPIDGSPPGPAVPGILQARTLEWVAISFSNA